ncbi:hypothetical protein [Pelotalea chapellei]|uniref:Uncharacterized protein n=1 Tax=Pelotalea chapellei TaxID=44671 RepID=A0ABS5U603_9BACT|nr:hypothetical protein [Pelotalea chapellei]MBT1071100.1 hypothetical protein [Pelotalea chapellei]
MRSIARIIPMLATALMINAVPGYAIEATGAMNEGLQKDECLLVAMNCRNQVDSIQQRIDRLQGEIARGGGVYSADELRVLKDKLEDANKILDSIVSGA